MNQNFEDYISIENVGSGAYGTVFKCIDKKTDSIVALKNFKFDNEEGIPSSFIVEVSILKMLHHPNIIKLKDYYFSDLNPVIVLEFFGRNLKEYLNKMFFEMSEETEKLLLKQLLEGIRYCHSQKIIHRDLKPENILVNNRGELKIADFGLARSFNLRIKCYAYNVVSLWYRCPELLLSCNNYSESIDIWSIGCIFYEILTNNILFKGKTKTDQLKRIIITMGSPYKYWEPIKKLPMYNLVESLNINEKVKKPTFKILPMHDNNVHELFDKLMCYNPYERISAKEALSCNYFKD